MATEPAFGATGVDAIWGHSALARRIDRSRGRGDVLRLGLRAWREEYGSLMSDSESSRLENPPILPQLKYEQPEQAIEWLGRVFGLTEESRLTGQDGALLIAALRSPLGGRPGMGPGQPLYPVAVPVHALMRA